MAQVRITDSEGTERATVPLVSLEKQQEGFNTKTLARITINRDDLNSITGLTPGEDRVFIEENGTDTFGGVLRSPGRSGGKPQLKAHSFAQYMARAKPVELGQQKIAVDDSTLIQECIDATPQLTAGTIETIASGKTWIFSGITQLAKAQKVAEAAGGELVFNSDLTVDYVDARGSDKTGTTLSPANSSFVENTFNVDRDGVSGNTTHLKVYGVGQGTSQVEATVVPEDDSGSYTNAVTYSNPNWSAGDDEIWGRRTNKDLKNVDALQEWGTTLIQDLQNEEVRVSTVVKGNTVELGDAFHLEHSKEDIDEDLRAVKVVQLLSNKGTRYEAVFSNYDTGHVDQVAEDHKDTGRYNQAYEGDLTLVQQGPGRGPVDSNHDYILYVYYPDDVVAEVNAQLLVKGTNYRAYSQGAASGGTTTSDENTSYGKVEERSESFSSETISNSSWTSIDTFSKSNAHSETLCQVNFSQFLDNNDVLVLEARVSETNGITIPNTGGHGAYLSRDSGEDSDAPPTNANMTFLIPGDTSDLTLEAKVDNVFGSGDATGNVEVDWYSVETHRHTLDPHAHGPDPGIIDWDGVDRSPDHYPENVDVEVNGDSQGVSLGAGTGEFEETVPLDNELTTGWNTIRLTSDALGHLDATFSADLFRQSL